MFSSNIQALNPRRSHKCGRLKLALPFVYGFVPRSRTKRFARISVVTFLQCPMPNAQLFLTRDDWIILVASALTWVGPHLDKPIF
ncbi:uncharacterized protein LY89DRAFT_687401 [Mollisia scopiformis]|uniref:Uncharacterized protein n=1 Tax=Mollisia scopiformis TaxID=149040 RepID=A0A194WZZ1_MOLSC|nr:uncharacterized protein LY89DRAFT_687401 [Mollisia scopiformis]KUJ13187.1 hypothetical protein LY89DRAFT_687401 [Mollisia scopiformis]